MELIGKKVSLNVYAGAVTYNNKYDLADDVITKMVQALEYSKKDTNPNLCFYSEKVSKQFRRYNLIKEKLKESIANNFKGFNLVYQPFMSHDGKKIIGCETLLRWKTEELKDVTPDEFIPILEESDDIIKVGRFVMEEAVKQQKESPNKFGY